MRILEIVLGCILGVIILNIIIWLWIQFVRFAVEVMQVLVDSVNEFFRKK